MESELEEMEAMIDTGVADTADLKGIVEGLHAALGIAAPIALSSWITSGLAGSPPGQR